MEALQNFKQFRSYNYKKLYLEAQFEQFPLMTTVK
jgi:hypothetical protein